MGNRLRQLREEKEMTLKELVNDLEKKTGLSISPDTLAKYEQGNREPKLERWQKLADYFDVSVGYLQGVTDKKDANIIFLRHQHIGDLKKNMTKKESEKLFKLLRLYILLDTKDKNNLEQYLKELINKNTNSVADTDKKN